MKRDLLKALLALVELALIVLAVLWVIGLFREAGLAEAPGERWVICQPDSYLTIREKPRKNGKIAGQLYLGDRIETDGKTKNGWLHIINASTEAGDGWVYARYVVDDEPMVVTGRAWVLEGGRVAVRRYPGGKRIRWLKPGQEVTVYAWTAEWCVTNRGFVDSDFLEGE